MILCNFTTLINDIEEKEMVIENLLADFKGNKYLTINNEVVILSLVCKNENTSKYLDFVKYVELIVKMLPKNCLSTYKKVNFLTDEEELKINIRGMQVENTNKYFIQ